MKVNIGPIRELRSGTVEFQGEQKVASLKEVEEFGLRFAKPIQVRGKVTNTGEGFLVEAELFLEYEVKCNRCLETYLATQKVEFKEEFVLSYNQREDESVFGFYGEIIDLQACIDEQVILALPMKFLCSEDCRGFCPECGTNLNQHQCKCAKEKMDSRFEKLKCLLPTKGGGSNGKPNE